MTDILIHPFARLTLLLIGAVALLCAASKAEPGWKIAILRGTFIGALFLLFTTFSGWHWELPTWAVAAQEPTAIEKRMAGSDIFTESPASALPSIETVKNTNGLPTFGNSEVHSMAGSLFSAFSFTILWMVVAAFLILRLLGSYLGLYRDINTEIQVPEQMKLYWQEVCGEFGIRTFPIQVTGKKASPHLLMDGTLMLPKDLLKSNLKRSSAIHLLRHEAAHLQAGDHYWFPIISALTSLLWCHPIAWWLASKHLQACEEARDAAAARIGGTEAYQSSIAEIALTLIPVTSQTPSLIRNRARLVDRLSRVASAVQKKPPQKTFTAAIHISVAVLAIALGCIVPQIIAAPVVKSIVGSWKCSKPDARHIKQIDVYEWSGAPKMKIWHALSADQISTKSVVVTLPLSVDDLNNFTSESNPLRMEHDYGFNVTRYTVSLTDKALKLETYVHYTDDSGREDQNLINYFQLGKYGEQKVLQPEKNTGWLGTWKNENKDTRGTAQLKITDLGDVILDVWGIVGKENKLYSNGTIKLPVSSSDAAEPKSGESIEVTSNNGYITVHYELTLKNDHLLVRQKRVYQQANRPALEVHYIFIRGNWYE